jgi:hypothetical protein
MIFSSDGSSASRYRKPLILEGCFVIAHYVWANAKLTDDEERAGDARSGTCG